MIIIENDNGKNPVVKEKKVTKDKEEKVENAEIFELSKEEFLLLKKLLASYKQDEERQKAFELVSRDKELREMITSKYSRQERDDKRDDYKKEYNRQKTVDNKVVDKKVDKKVDVPPTTVVETVKTEKLQ